MTRPLFRDCGFHPCHSQRGPPAPVSPACVVGVPRVPHAALAMTRAPGDTVGPEAWAMLPGTPRPCPAPSNRWPRDVPAPPLPHGTTRSHDSPLGAFFKNRFEINQRNASYVFSPASFVENVEVVATAR